MKKRITKNRYILFILVFFISLGFAYLSANLNILGALSYNAASFDVHFDDLELDNESYEGAVLPTLNQEKDTISMNFSFDKPGDKLIYTADIINSGTIDAQLGDLNITNNLSSENADLLDLSIKYLDGIDVKSGDVILKGARKTIKVIVGYSTNIEVSDLPTEVVPLTIEIGPGFEQCDLNTVNKAVFKTGEQVNALIKRLSDYVIMADYNPSIKNISPSFLNSLDNNVTIKNINSIDDPIYNFIKSDTLASGLTDDNIASTDDSDVPIYLWFEGKDDSDFGTGTIYWYSDADIVYFNDNSSSFFKGFDYLTNISGTSNISVSLTSSISEMFSNCMHLSDLSPIKNWDVSNVIFFNELFLYCKNLVDVSLLRNWNVENVQDFTSMFSDCYSLVDVSGLSNWDTKSVISMESLFVNCNSLSNISGLSNWNISNVKTIDSMFAHCSNINNFDAISNWNTSSIVSMNDVFNNCGISSLSPLSGWDVSNVEVMSWLFYGCTSLSNLSGLSSWNVGKVEKMDTMFARCTSLNDLSQISGWNVINVTTMDSMFVGCTSLTNVSPIGSWNISSLTNISTMFSDCTSLTNITGLSGWNVSNVTNMISMFLRCSSLSDITALRNWNVNNVDSMRFIFSSCTSLTDATCLNGWYSSFSFDKHYDMFENTSLTSSTKPSWYTGNL